MKNIFNVKNSIFIPLILIFAIGLAIPFYYFYASDCCISPTCTECLFEGEVPCKCDIYLEHKQYEKVCEECHIKSCDTHEQACAL